MQLVVSSKAAGMAAPIDGVTVSFNDPSLIEDAVRKGRRRGFGAKLCIHPAQIAATHRAFLPTRDELEAARRIVDADRKSGGAAVAIDGKMADKPIVARAYKVLAGAGVWKAIYDQMG